MLRIGYFCLGIFGLGIILKETFIQVVRKLDFSAAISRLGYSGISRLGYSGKITTPIRPLLLYSALSQLCSSHVGIGLAIKQLELPMDITK